MTWFTYILLCDQKTFYVGSTSDINKRFKSHLSKSNISTKKFSELELVYYEPHISKGTALKREYQIKGWTKAKKKALIGGNIELLKKLSRTRSLSKVTQR